jgi:hypothetical protein
VRVKVPKWEAEATLATGRVIGTHRLVGLAGMGCGLDRRDDVMRPPPALAERGRRNDPVSDRGDNRFAPTYSASLAVPSDPTIARLA